MIQIDSSKCIGCSTCAKECFYGRIVMEKRKASLLVFSCWNCMHCIAICPVGAIQTDPDAMGQVVEYDENTFFVSPKNLLNKMKFRRSMRQFKQEPLPQEVLLGLLEAGRYVPNGGNRQILRYILLKDSLSQIRDMAIHAFHAVAQRNDPEEIARVYMGNIGYHHYWKTAAQAYKDTGADRLFYHAPVVLLAVGPKNDPIASMDAAIALANISLLAETEEIGACFIAFFQMACEADPSILNHLGLSCDEAPLAVLALGKPAFLYHRTAPRNTLQVELR